MLRRLGHHVLTTVGSPPFGLNYPAGTLTTGCSSGVPYEAGGVVESYTDETFADVSETPQPEESPTAVALPREEVPIGTPLTLSLELPKSEGTVLLKAGPLVIRLAPEQWTETSMSFSLPDLQLMRPAEADLYVLDDAGQLITEYSLLLMPKDDG